ncbi:unnamed protein product [Microthlaspi erraticum]|uniref:Uncharacterized protein n=1 Tax=Microthlaspi erraticum TaxID=1685480 RepID=A0A6D2KVP8_9BRAS|nr:unnamed protein product [Microthlaspi erraticum]
MVDLVEVHQETLFRELRQEGETACFGSDRDIDASVCCTSSSAGLETPSAVIVGDVVVATSVASSVDGSAWRLLACRSDGCFKHH